MYVTTLANVSTAVWPSLFAVLITLTTPSDAVRASDLPRATVSAAESRPDNVSPTACTIFSVSTSVVFRLSPKILLTANCNTCVGFTVSANALS